MYWRINNAYIKETIIIIIIFDFPPLLYLKLILYSNIFIRRHILLDKSDQKWLI